MAADPATLETSLPVDAPTSGDPVDELRWLADLLGTNPDRTVDYLARPDLDDLRLLVPTAPPAAAAAALRRPHDDRSWIDRAQTVGGRALARLGQLGRAPGATVQLPQYELVDHLALRLGEHDLVTAVTIGARRRNRKPVLQLIRPDGRVVGFAKVGWSPLTREMVATEHAALTAVAGALTPDVVAPPVLLHDEWRDLTIAVTAELRPPRLSWGQAPTDADVVRAIAAVAAGVTTVGSSTTIDAARAAGLDRLIDLERFLARHGPVELAVGLWHGDYTPWNLVRRGRTLLLWDWELAGWGRPVGFDLLHHSFEAHRRRPGGSGGAGGTALGAAIAAAPRVLAPLELDLGAEQVAAIVDLYLCELLIREQRLSDQRWSGGTLADLGPHLIDALAARLR